MIQILCCFLGAIIIFIVGFCVGCSWIFKRNFNFTKEQCRRGDKMTRMFGVLNQWMQLKEENKNIVSYFKKMEYNNIAIYGIGYIGKHLVKELNGAEIHIDYLIDRYVEEIEESITIYKPDMDLPETDVIVVTAIMDFNEIAGNLETKTQCPIISIEDIIYGID